MTKRGALLFLAGFASACASMTVSVVLAEWFDERHVASHHSRVYPAHGENERR